jgi:hypothetical protein
MIESINLQNITNILNEFLNPFDCEAFPGTDFGYYTASNRIEYSFTVPDQHEKTFMNFVNKNFPRIDANPFLWSFLHELGHHETEDNFNEEQWNQYRHFIRNCNDDYTYYNLPIERAATEWAANYMITHEDEVRKLWYKLVPIILAFYKDMEVNVNNET